MFSCGKERYRERRRESVPVANRCPLNYNMDTQHNGEDERQPRQEHLMQKENKTYIYK